MISAGKFRGGCIDEEDGMNGEGFLEGSLGLVSEIYSDRSCVKSVPVGADGVSADGVVATSCRNVLVGNTRAVMKYENERGSTKIKCRLIKSVQ